MATNLAIDPALLENRFSRVWVAEILAQPTPRA